MSVMTRKKFLVLLFVADLASLALVLSVCARLIESEDHFMIAFFVVAAVINPVLIRFILHNFLRCPSCKELQIHSAADWIRFAFWFWKVPPCKKCGSLD
jgi:hypothetical protein